MKLLFNNTFSYKFDKSAEEIKNHLHSLVLSGKYIGAFNLNTFKLSRPAFYGGKLWPFQSVIKGEVAKKDDKYIVNIELHYHWSTILVFVFTVLIISLSVLTNYFFNTSVTEIIFIVPFVTLIWIIGMNVSNSVMKKELLNGF